MSDLTAARDHARAMADRHIDPRDVSRALSMACDPTFFFDLRHADCRSADCSCACHPRHVPTDAERALWRQIADEIDTYLASSEDHGQEALL